MKRLRKENINTPKHFDKIFSDEGNKFDVERQNYFVHKIKPGMKALDLGAGLYGFGHFYYEAQGSGAEIYAVDFSQYAKERTENLEPRVRYEIGDILNTRFEDGYFDLVGAGEVIEHIEKPQELITEMARLTKKGGLMLISTVDPDCEDSKGIEYPEHIWQFTKDDLLDLFKGYGQSEYSRIGNYDCVCCRRG